MQLIFVFLDKVEEYTAVWPWEESSSVLPAPSLSPYTASSGSL